MPCCKECGFLAVQHRITRQLEEADKAHRGSGDSAHYVGQVGYQGRIYEDVPICLVRAADFAEEIKTPTNPYARNCVLAVIARERDCNSWVRWKQGFSPKDHKDMIDSESIRRKTRFHNNCTLAIAVASMLVAASSTVFSALKSPGPIKIEPASAAACGNANAGRRPAESHPVGYPPTTRIPPTTFLLGHYPAAHSGTF